MPWSGELDRASVRHARTARAWTIGGVLAVAILSQSIAAEPIAVHHTEGIVHGFLVLRTLDGAAIADGELVQSASNGRVTSRLSFRFRDGSVHEETAVFTQQQQFRLVSDHLVQKGPTFERPLDMTIDAESGRVVVHYSDKGEAKTESEQLELPPDLANGLILTLLKNVSPEAPPKSLSYVAATPKPRLVKLELTAAGTERFATGRTGRSATHYRLKVNIGGVSGVLAEVFGKEPPDSHVWILGGEAPAFVKSEQALFVGGPLWRIELVSPVWPKASKPN